MEYLVLASFPRRVLELEKRMRVVQLAPQHLLGQVNIAGFPLEKYRDMGFKKCPP